MQNNKIKELIDIVVSTNELAIANTSLLLPLVEAAIADGKIADSPEVRATLEALRLRVQKSQDDAQATRKYFGVG
jgi:ribosomal protein S2